MSIKLDNKTVSDLEGRGVDKIKLFFYNAGCSGTKLNLEEDFELDDSLEKIASDYSFDIYVLKEDISKFDGVVVTKAVTADHTGKEKVRYIFTSEKVKDRCGCGSSFSFEKKVPKLNLDKLKELKNNFN